MIRQAAVLALSLFAAPIVAADEPVAPATAGSAIVFDGLVRDTIARYRLPGIAVGVIENGKITYAQGHGETVVGSGEAVTPDTIVTQN